MMGLFQEDHLDSVHTVVTISYSLPDQRLENSHLLFTFHPRFVVDAIMRNICVNQELRPDDSLRDAGQLNGQNQSSKD